MVSFTRALFAASAILAATVGAQADVGSTHSFALDRRARAFGVPVAHHHAALAVRGPAPQRRGRRCRKPSSSSKSSSGSGSESASASHSSPTSQSSPHSKSWSSSSSSSPSHKSKSGAPSSSHSASWSSSPSSSSKSHSGKSSSSAATSSSSDGKHWASSSAKPTWSKSSAPSSSSSSSSSASAPSSSGSGSGSGSSSGGNVFSGSAAGTHTGELTYYAPGLGACGWTNSESDYIAAIGSGLYEQYGSSNSNKLCGHQIALTYKGKTVNVKAVDECPGCSEYSLDLSPAAFKALADESEGRLTGATWKFVS